MSEWLNFGVSDIKVLVEELRHVVSETFGPYAEEFLGTALFLFIILIPFIKWVWIPMRKGK